MAVRILVRLAASSTCLRKKRPRMPCTYTQLGRSLLLCCGGGGGAGGGGGKHPLNPICSEFGRRKNMGGVRRRSTITRGRRRRVTVPTPRRGDSAEDNDEYRWMQDINSDEVVQHLEHENRFAAFALGPLERRGLELHRCMMERLPEEEGGDKRSVPERLGPHLYYTRRDDGKGFPLYVRRPAKGTVADEEVILDLNEIEAHGLLGVAADSNRAGGIEEAAPEPAGTDGTRPAPRLRSMKLSSDQRMLACTIDVEGADHFALAVFELGGGGSRRDGANAPLVIRNDLVWSDVIGVEWGANPCSHDGKAGSGGGGRDGDAYELYYTVPDKLRRPWQVRRVLLRPTTATKTRPAQRDDGSKGSFSDHADNDDNGVRWEADAGSDEAVFEETDDAFFADVGKTKDHAFVVINVHSKTTSEVLFQPVAPAPASIAATATVPEATAAVDTTASRSKAQTTSEVEREETSGFDDGSHTASSGGGSRGGGDSDNIENAHCRRSPTLLRRRQQGVEYYVDHAGDSFYLVTNCPPHDGAPSFSTGPPLPPTSPTPKPHLRTGGIKALWQRLTSNTLGSTDNGSYGTSTRTTTGGGRHRAVPENFPHEYRLVRVRQQPGRTVSSPLEGIADAPWETVPAVPGLGAGDGGAEEGGAGSSDKLTPCSDARDRHRSGAGISRRTRGDVNHTRTELTEEDNRNDRHAGAGDGKPESGGTIEEMDLFREHCVLYEISAAGSPRLRVVPLADPEAAFVVFPPSPGGCPGNGDSEGSPENLSTNGAAAAVLRPGVNSWVESKTVRFTLSSPTAPEDVYNMCLESGRLDLLRRTKVPGTPQFNSQDYSCYRVQVCSRDGEQVPLTIAHREGLRLDGNNRLLLHGYGAYGMSLPIDYHAGHACMLERGWVMAFAHVRGGGERGKAWHAAGRRQNKWNSFHDFEACAEHLVSSKYTTPSNMGLHVSSAGGLLAGVMANTRPDLFSAMVMKAPFLGVLSAMRDTSLPLTVHEFDEWGDPSESPDVEAMIRSYCPYENVRRHKYPALLVSASVNDTRVSYWDPAKWVSRVRANNVGDKPILLRVSDSDAHEGPGNMVEALQDYALEMAFLEQHLCGGNS